MYYGQFDLDKIIEERFFSKKKNGFFVECGAFDGVSDSTCKFFEESMGWTGLNIEPTPYAYDKLVINRPNGINEKYALSNHDGKAVFKNAIHPKLKRHFGNGSLKHSDAHMKELLDTGCTFEDFEVDCIKFSILYQKHNLSAIDLFVLDVEGHEENALAGILEIPELGLPKVFCIEHTITGIDKLNQILSTHYTFHSKYKHNAFYTKK